MPPPSLREAWASQEPAFRRALERAFEGLRAGGLPVGAALTDELGQIIADGRNHAYDPPGGPDVLQGTPLAHAEMNTLASVSTGRSLNDCTLWSTQQPCLMCAAAATFAGVGTIRYLAPDPWAESDAGNPIAARIAGVRTVGPGEDRWIVAANLLFLLGIARMRGVDHETVRANREIEPETTVLVVRLVDETGTTAASLFDFLERIWVDVERAAGSRAERRRSRPT
jgi:tRNA(Arg) A34 adenosine deaminase TadA